jgi:hypothetical protein
LSVAEASLPKTRDLHFCWQNAFAIPDQGWAYDASTIVGRIVYYALLLFVVQMAFGVFGPPQLPAAPQSGLSACRLRVELRCRRLSRDGRSHGGVSPVRPAGEFHPGTALRGSDCRAYPAVRSDRIGVRHSRGVHRTAGDIAEPARNALGARGFRRRGPGIPGS